MIWYIITNMCMYIYIMPQRIFHGYLRNYNMFVLLPSPCLLWVCDGALEGKPPKPSPRMRPRHLVSLRRVRCRWRVWAADVASDLQSPAEVSRLSRPSHPSLAVPKEHRPMIPRSLLALWVSQKLIIVHDMSKLLLGNNVRAASL